MTLNTFIPALRRSIRLRISATNMSGTSPFYNQPMPSPLTREQTRLAVIEVLG